MSAKDKKPRAEPPGEVVARKLYEQTVVRAVKAETAAGMLREERDGLRRALEDERARHAETIRDILDRYAPKEAAQGEPAFTGGGEGAQYLHSDLIRSTKAVGIRGLHERHVALHGALAREEAARRGPRRQGDGTQVEDEDTSALAEVMGAPDQHDAQGDQ